MAVSPKQADLLDVYRRIAERGLKHARSRVVSLLDGSLRRDGWPDQVDLWQHFLDELDRFTKEP